MLKTKENISFPPVPEEFDSEWCRTIHEILRDMSQDIHSDLGAVRIPIGTIMSWDKDSTGTPDLPAGWVEMNGQTLNDSASPYHGTVIPNLNGAAAGADLNDGVNDNLGKTGDIYLKGDEASGKTEEDTIQLHGHSITLDIDTTSAQSGIVMSSALHTSYSSDGPIGAPVENGAGGTPRTGTTTKPRSYSVVWIKRVK